ncbi:N-acetyltransferase, partial [Streptomyces rochei]
MELKISSLAERPEMLDRVREMADSWPAFAVEDLSGNAHYPRIAVELPQYVQFAEDEHGEVVAHGHSVP